MESRKRFNEPLVARSDIPAEPLERRTDTKPEMATLGQVLFSNAKKILMNIFAWENIHQEFLIRLFNMDYCAEVSYIRCNNGYRLPMEIAFARVDNPRQVFILHMRMPHDVYFTVTDLVCNKGQCERRNKGLMLMPGAS
ncbi:hypothetical protein TNCT_346601 [Trichonephila clavata]|uniref:Uncharacterized protein n=1 Tax=Trichonephila clavata TaxID=2740835 RepID=A0A8X6KS05_TRICU|nr:hypothetical protein TNCT_346601 [Trichonephila clavata]